LGWVLEFIGFRTLRILVGPWVWDVGFKVFGAGLKVECVGF